MYLHPTYAVTPEREPLGVLDAWMWAREMRNTDGVRPGQKESTRWIEGYKRIAEMAEQMPQTRLVYLTDREADMVAMMRRARQLGTPADFYKRPGPLIHSQFSNHRIFLNNIVGIAKIFCRFVRLTAACGIVGVHRNANQLQ